VPAAFGSSTHLQPHQQMHAIEVSSGAQQLLRSDPHALEAAERMRAFAAVLARYLTPLQASAALEEWELVCEEHGWS
jgi:hypothetical protein